MEEEIIKLYSRTTVESTPEFNKTIGAMPSNFPTLSFDFASMYPSMIRPFFNEVDATNPTHVYIKETASLKMLNLKINDFVEIRIIKTSLNNYALIKVKSPASTLFNKISKRVFENSFRELTLTEKNGHKFGI